MYNFGLVYAAFPNQHPVIVQVMLVYVRMYTFHFLCHSGTGAFLLRNQAGILHEYLESFPVHPFYVYTSWIMDRYNDRVPVRTVGRASTHYEGKIGMSYSAVSSPSNLPG